MSSMFCVTRHDHENNIYSLLSSLIPTKGSVTIDLPAVLLAQVQAGVSRLWAYMWGYTKKSSLILKAPSCWKMDHYYYYDLHGQGLGMAKESRHSHLFILIHSSHCTLNPKSLYHPKLLKLTTFQRFWGISCYKSCLNYHILWNMKRKS